MIQRWDVINAGAPFGVSCSGALFKRYPLGFHHRWLAIIAKVSFAGEPHAGGSKGALWCQHRLGVIIVGGPFAEVWVSCGSQGYSLGDDMIPTD